jgi:F-type H+-transporting ATPase subunit a
VHLSLCAAEQSQRADPWHHGSDDIDHGDAGLGRPHFSYYNFYGVREQGVIGYIKHFCGPIWWMAPLLLPIEIVSHLARVMSLSVRLYANMFAGDLVTLVFFSLIPIGIPIIFLGLHLFVSLIQAFVFMLLTMIYLSLAVAHEH